MVGIGFLINQGGRFPASGSVAAENVEIDLHPAYHETFLPAASALIDALSEAGVAVRDAGYNTNNANESAVHILIGDKRSFVKTPQEFARESSI